MELEAISVGGFRSIGAETITIDLTKKINVIIGPNDVGKSNIIYALKEVSKRRAAQEKVKYDNLEIKDLFHRNASNSFYIGLTGLITESDYKEIKEPVRISLGYIIGGENGDKWYKNSFQEMRPDRLEFLQPVLTGRKTPDVVRDDVKQYVANELAGFMFPRLLKCMPQSYIIPVFRQVKSGSEYELSGTGIIEFLATWQNPPQGFRELRKKFDAVQLLLRDRLDREKLELSINMKSDDIVIVQDDFDASFELHGTGIHELLIMAVAIYSQDNALVCIEEPEIHLHPRLQKKFFEFLRDHPTNKFLISTHSNAFLSLDDDINVIRVWMEKGVTRGKAVTSSSHALEILDDLGYKASDLLQANSVIWVEGPSDRIYINEWLNLLAPELREGIDYSIMFYGGRLLAHLGVERDEKVPEPDDLIPLLKINQHAAIVIDSDRDKAGASISETKQRIEKECAENKVYCWITDGREIENYLTKDQIETTYNNKLGVTGSVSFGNYKKIEDVLKNAYKAIKERADYYSEKKPEMAREIVKTFQKDDIKPPLKDHLDKIIEMIRTATS